MTVRRRSSIVKQLSEETEGLEKEQETKSPGFKARDSMAKNAICRDLSMANLKAQNHILTVLSQEMAGTVFRFTRPSSK